MTLNQFALWDAKNQNRRDYRHRQIQLLIQASETSKRGDAVLKDSTPLYGFGDREISVESQMDR